MVYLFAADALLLFHLAFVAFVVLGGALVLRWSWVAWLHLPALAWGVCIECAGWICPLTPLENVLRGSAGESGYAEDFIGHYLLSALYPAGLTREIQVALGVLVLLVNVGLYALVWRRRWRNMA